MDDDVDNDLPPESGNEGESRRSRRSVIPELVRRAVELGVEKAQGAPDNVKNFVGDMKLPKEIAQVVFTQIDETKNGLFRVVAKEMRDFLEQTNFSGEIQKLLTTVQFEVNTTIRFTPNDGKTKKKSKKDPPKDDNAGQEAHASDEGVDGEEEDAPPPPNDEEDTDRRPLPRPEVKSSLRVHRERRGRG